jgi:hypothetical protein
MNQNRPILEYNFGSKKQIKKGHRPFFVRDRVELSRRWMPIMECSLDLRLKFRPLRS